MGDAPADVGAFAAVGSIRACSAWPPAAPVTGGVVLVDQELVEPEASTRSSPGRARGLPGRPRRPLHGVAPAMPGRRPSSLGARRVRAGFIRGATVEDA